MRHAVELPNLLDHHVSRDDMAAMIDRLRLVRREVYARWTAGSSDHPRSKALQRAVDDVLVLALVVQYLGRLGNGNILFPSAAWARQDSVGKMAGLASGEVPKGAHILLDRAFASNRHWPEHIRGWLFADRLPAAFRPFAGELPITILGDFHQMCLSNPLDGTGDERRAKGAHYTPSSLVDYMVARALTVAGADGIDPRRMRILDPSCGCGAFLIAVLRYLVNAGCRQGGGALSRGLHGSDIDARAIDLARLSLLMAALHSRAGQWPGPKLWNHQLVKQDFLARSSWQNAAFDLIIAGPPFIRVEQLHAADPQRVADYRRRYQTAQSGQFDLYMLFMEKAIHLLRPGGRLAFSVSSGFLRSKSGRAIRQFLAENGQVEEIVEFEDGNIYPDAAVQVAAIMIRKGGGPAKATRYVLVPGGRPVRQHLERLLQPTCKSIGGRPVLSVGLDEYGGDEWNLRSPGDAAFLRHMDATGTLLGEFPVRVSLGMCTGADDIFILRLRRGANGRRHLTTRGGSPVRIESAVLKPILRARQSRLAQGDMPNVCIFPYDSKGVVLDERAFGQRFPLAYGYLLAHKKRLASRRLCPGQPWFALRKTDVACHLAKPKIIAPTIVSFRGFQLDVDGVLCHHGLLTIAPLSKEIDPHYLLGVLNSSTLWRYVCLRTARMGAGRQVLRREMARALPIVLPEATRQRALAAEIARQVRKQAAPRCVDRLVAELHGLAGCRAPKSKERPSAELTRRSVR